MVWRGFTLDNYVKAWNNRELQEALINSLAHRGDGDGHFDRDRRDAGDPVVAVPFPGKGAYEGFMALPIVIPEICMGVALRCSSPIPG